MTAAAVYLGLSLGPTIGGLLTHNFGWRSVFAPAFVLHIPALIMLFLFGGEIIHNFALALIIGVLVGTYSSIYVASSAVLMLGVSKADLMPTPKEGQQLDEQP